MMNARREDAGGLRTRAARRASERREAVRTGEKRRQSGERRGGGGVSSEQRREARHSPIMPSRCSPGPAVPRAVPVMSSALSRLCRRTGPGPAVPLLLSWSCVVYVGARGPRNFRHRRGREVDSGIRYHQVPGMSIFRSVSDPFQIRDVLR